MKANKAPEKIWMDLEWIPHFDCKDCITEDSIEYIRKDAFIEKALDWLRKKLCDYFDAPRGDYDMFIDEFRNYMEGE